MIRKFYHYTTIENLNKILESGYLLPSYFSRHDTIHGEGWYLTDLTPDNSDLKLQKTLWNANVPEKTKCYVEFHIEETILKECNDHIYLIKLETIPDSILNLKVNYFENNTYLSFNNSKVVLKYAGYNIRKNNEYDNKNEIDWKPIVQLASVFVGIIGVAALINAVIKSK